MRGWWCMSAGMVLHECGGVWNCGVCVVVVFQASAGPRAQWRGSCRHDNQVLFNSTLMLLVCVALNSIVCRCTGRLAKMASMVLAKPMSSVRSASSSTSTCRLPGSKPGVSSMCCSRRPGVQTRMLSTVDGGWRVSGAMRCAWCCYVCGHALLCVRSACVDMHYDVHVLRCGCVNRTGQHTPLNTKHTPLTRCISSLTSLPPMSRPAENSWRAPTRRSCWKICRASSRVGVMTRAPRPSYLFHRSL